MELIETLQPNLLVKGADYKREDVVGGDFVEAKGGHVLLVNIAQGHSTSNIIKRQLG